MQTVLIIGATGAQGEEIVRYLASTNAYKVLVFTRNPSGSRAQDLAAVPNVELVVSNTEAGYDISAFSAAAERSDAVFINTDGFALGELAETYWGIHLYELSVRAGVKHVIYSGLDYNYRESGYDPKYYVGHYEGKAKVQEFLHAQPASPVSWTIIRSGPYLENLSEIFQPQAGADGKQVFYIPLDDGAIPFIHLQDFARYVDWALRNPEKSRGLDFGIATAHVTGKELADAFTAVRGVPAEYVSIPADAWTQKAFEKLPQGKDTKVGFKTVKDPNALRQTFGENFTNWFNLYKASGGNKGLIKRDYKQLDDILPDRVKSIEEWMKKTGYDGSRITLLQRASG